ncbi:MAG: porphobilinogen synthase, partial [Candidatus Puniceispirillum sp.]
MSRGQFPSTRMRRNRMQSFSRRLMAESSLSVDDLIWPMFVIEGQEIDEPIASMPGQYRYSIDRLIEKAGEAVTLSIPAIAVFPALDTSKKDADGTGALDGDNLVCRAVRAVKDAYPDLGIICDVALDPFTDHGHDGVIRNGMVANDETIEILCQQAVLQANAGCDIIAPSDMMDGRVGAIRTALDNAGHQNVIIMSYAAKYASAFYGPFRDAVKAGASLGSAGKSSYQMDPANSDEAMHEIGLDLQEGADMVIVKPGMPYLDVLNRAKTEFGVPCIA